MLTPTFNLILATAIPLILLIVMFLTKQRAIDSHEKASPFECGFDPKSSARLPFSLRFFMLAVIFLVFDIEIALLMPVPIALAQYLTSTLILGSVPFILILLIGLLHEWREGSLDWAN